jgi:hypothetical protein
MTSNKKDRKEHHPLTALEIPKNKSMTYSIMLQQDSPAGVATGVAEFDAAVVQFGSEDLVWLVGGKVKADRLNVRYQTPSWCDGFILPEEGWHALERLMLADTVMRICQFQTDQADPKADKYDINLRILADWLVHTRWALELMDRRHQQDGQLRVRDFEDWKFTVTAGIYLLKQDPKAGWSPRLEGYIDYLMALLRVQLSPNTDRSMKPSEVRDVFDKFLELAGASTVNVTAIALPESQEAIAERLNEQRTG